MLLHSTKIGCHSDGEKARSDKSTLTATNNVTLMINDTLEDRPRKLRLQHIF